MLDDWARLMATPGRKRQSLEASSVDAWIKLYKPDESNLNTTVSYYLKGGLAMFALDLHIRRRTEGARSLDDVLRALWQRYGATGEPHPDDLQPAFEQASGLWQDTRGVGGRNGHGHQGDDACACTQPVPQDVPSPLPGMVLRPLLPRTCTKVPPEGTRGAVAALRNAPVASSGMASSAGRNTPVSNGSTASPVDISRNFRRVETAPSTTRM